MVRQGALAMVKQKLCGKVALCHLAYAYVASENQVL